MQSIGLLEIIVIATVCIFTLIAGVVALALVLEQVRR